MEENEMTTSSGTQALDSVLAKVASDRAQRIVAKLEDLHKRQESIRDTLDKVAAHLDKTNAQQVVEERREKSRAYYAKLKDIRTGMFEIDERTARLQIRLNGIRRDGPQQNALVERGPFHYKCMYRGGVRYRKYPSSTAKVTGAMINFNDVAEVCERVFITGEFSIFLHVKGVGWLFENKDSTICMRRVVYDPEQHTNSLPVEDDKKLGSMPQRKSVDDLIQEISVQDLEIDGDDAGNT